MTDRLLDALRRLGRARRASVAAAPKGVEPCCPFDVLLERRIDELEADLGEVRGRANGLLLLLAGAVLAQVVLRLMGV